MADTVSKSFCSCFSFLYFLVTSSSSLVSFSKMSFLLLFLAVIPFFGSDSVIHPRTPSFELHFPQNPGPVWRRRLIRSPFLHPTVTSFRKVTKKPNRRKDLNVKVVESYVPAISPIATSQKAGVKRHEKPSPRMRHPTILHRKDHGESAFPRPPMVFHQTVKVKEDSPSKAVSAEPSVLPQNDQHPLPFLMEEADSSTFKQKGLEEEIPKKLEEGQVKERDPEVFTFDKAKPQETFDEYHRILKVIDKNTEELQQILKKERLTLDEYLGFIDKGVTKGEILDFLNLSNQSELLKSKYKSDNQFTVKNTEPNYHIKKLERQKILTDLPFTEIVHEIPLDREKSYEDLKEATFKKKMNDYDYKKSQKKFQKKLKENFKEKKHNSKKAKLKSEKNNPFLMNSDYDTVLPAKDSPIIIPFLPSRRKERKKESASIISFTIEKSKENNRATTHPVSKLLPVRSKVLSTNDGKPFESEPAPTRPIRTSTYQHQQSNLRLVFPMKGILLFCGSLGVISVVTIVILIIYGAVKCNRQTNTNTYQMSERPDMSET